MENMGLSNSTLPRLGHTVLGGGCSHACRSGPTHSGSSLGRAREGARLEFLALTDLETSAHPLWESSDASIMLKECMGGAGEAEAVYRDAGR